MGIFLIFHGNVYCAYLEKASKDKFLLDVTTYVFMDK